MRSLRLSKRMKKINKAAFKKDKEILDLMARNDEKAKEVLGEKPLERWNIGKP
jgi:hypothetical protein